MFERKTILPRIKTFVLLTTLLGGVAVADELPRLFEIEPGEPPSGRGVGAAWRVAVDDEMVFRGIGRMQLDLPDGLELTAVRRDLERRGPRSALWRGRLIDADGGDVVLSLHEGLLSGYITSAYGEYEIRPLADGDHMVAKIDREELVGCEPIPVGAEEQSTQPVSPPVGLDGPGNIDVLVLYSPEMRDALGGRPQAIARVQLMIDTANTAYVNSGMNARLNLVHATVSGFSETGDGHDDLDRLRLSNQAANLREAYQADLVAFVVSDSDLCGVGYILTSLNPAFESYAFSTTHMLCIDTFAHEVGHNMGFHHDPANVTEGAPLVFPWAYGHYVANNFRTLMAYPDPCGNCARPLNFSSPHRHFNGHATGIANGRDNARVGNQTAPLLANFRQSGLALEDDFESGTISGWALNRGPLGLVQPGLGGSFYALDVPITGLPGRKFLMHRIGEPGHGVTVEFDLNMNGADLGSADVDVLALLGRGQPHTKLTVRQVGGTYWLILTARADTGVFQEVTRTPLRPFFDERIRVEWLRSTSAAAPDGFVRLAKNGGNRGAFREFDNDEWPVRELRIGIPYGAAGAPAGGFVLIDDYRASLPPLPESSEE